MRWTLRVIAVVYVVMLVAWPTYLVFERALEPGLGAALDSLRDPEVGHAIYLTLYITFFAVVINLVFGLTVSILLVRYDFPGKRVLSCAARRTAVRSRRSSSASPSCSSTTAATAGSVRGWRAPGSRSSSPRPA